MTCVFRPTFSSSDSHIHIEQGRHPVVNALLGEAEQYVPNDTHLQVIIGPFLIPVYHNCLINSMVNYWAIL